jgi:hypothetical protein
MLKSESIKSIMPALLAAQAEIKGALRDANNAHTGKKYADLTSVFEACKPALNKHGILVQQSVADTAPGFACVLTHLIHAASGEFVGCSLSLRPGKDDPQGIGSAITYARRYTLATLAGVCPDDDDGHAASQQAARPAPAPVAPKPAPPKPVAPAAPPAASITMAELKTRKEKAMDSLCEMIGSEKADATLAELKKTHNNAATPADALAIVKDLEFVIQKGPTK